MPAQPNPHAPDCPKCGKRMANGARTASGKIRWLCRNAAERTYCYSTTNPKASRVRKQDGRSAPKGFEIRDERVFRRALGESKIFIITAAQNATPVSKPAWECLKQIAKHRGAEILVLPIRYKNPTSTFTASQANEDIWAEETIPYLWNVQRSLNENLVLIGDAKTQPTASDPLTGYDALSGSASAIIGHTKIQLKTIATPANRMSKILTTTGAITVPNFTDSKAGKLGDFHHSIAALIVEVQGKRFHLRHVHYDRRTESFTDLDTRYFVDRHEKAPRPLALVMGDTHVDFISPEVERATFGPGGIVQTMRPENLVWHDVLDAYAVNVHHNGNPFNAIAKWGADRGSIFEEVQRACRFVRDRTPIDGTTKSVVVPSNHDDMLRRWIIQHDWKTDPINAEFYLKAAHEMVRGTKLTASGTEYPSPFPMVFPSMVDSMEGIRLLKSDETFSIGRVELGMHGDRGPNGARGSARNLRRIGIRSIIGHSHSPGIDEGCYQVGTSTQLRLEYNGGPSSWLNAHCLLHADGKRQLIFIIDGEWRSKK